MSLVGCFGLNEPNLLVKQTGNMRSLIETQIHVAVKHKIHEAQTYRRPSRTALHITTMSSTCYESWIKGTIFTTGRLYKPLAVRMVTTHTHPSSPRLTPSIIATGHLVGGASSPSTQTTSPTCRFLEWDCHLRPVRTSTSIAIKSRSDLVQSCPVFT